MSSIRQRLLVIIVLLLVLSLGTLAGLGYYFSKQALARSVDETVRAIGTDYAQRVQSAMRERVIFLQDVAANPYVLSGDRQQLLAATKEAFKRNGNLDTLTFIAPDGNGQLVTGATVSLGDRDYFKAVVASKQPVISEPLVVKSTGKLSVNTAVPVMNNGALVGVLNGGASLTLLEDLVKNIKFKDSGYGAIFDDTGLLIAHGKRPELIGKLNLTEKKVNPELNLGISEIDDSLLKLFDTAAKTGNQVQGSYTFADKAPNLGVFTPVELPGGHRWIVLVSAPEAEATREVGTLSMVMLVTALVCCFIGVLVLVYISAQFARPIVKLRNEALLLAEGDLRQRAITSESQNEIGQLAGAFGQMADKLRNLVRKVQSQAETVAASAEELTAGANQAANAANQVSGSIIQIAEGSDKQSAAVNDMSAVVDDMSASIKQIAAAGKQIAEFAIGAAASTEQGREDIGQAIQQMNDIGEGARAVQQAISNLAQGSREINDIVSLISSIAGQTNLLALNAAIEAARAGEAGRGFAVVAEEVRKLAEGSNQAAQKIAALIQKNETDMNQAIAATETSNAGVNTGIDVVKSAGDTFKAIADTVERLSSQIQDITRSIDQIAAGSQNLVAAVQNIDTVSKVNASEAQSVSAATEEQSASMQEIASSSQALAQTSAELQSAVANFKV
jgi:methyl-accepting chemotaxis protein